jgi:hypothetical protein
MTPAVLLVALAAEPAPAAPPAEPEKPEYVVPIVHDLAVLTVVRAAETVIWPEPFARPSQFGPRYEEAYTRPPVFDASRRIMEWDGDPWYVNAIGHPLLGSELYLRPRSCRVPWHGALAFVTVASTVWEYGFEANGARPSALDLVWTPLAGAALGEVRFQIVRASTGIASRGLRATVRAIADPFGEIERAMGAVC